MHELQRGELLRDYRRDLVRRVRDLTGGGVLGDIRRELVRRMHVLPGWRILEPDRRERVHYMPDGILFFCYRIHIHHKLLLQRRVLRPERRRVHGVCVHLHISTGKFDNC